MSNSLLYPDSEPNTARKRDRSPLSHEYVPSTSSPLDTPTDQHDLQLSLGSSISHIPEHRDSFAKRTPHRSRDIALTESAASSAENLDVESSMLSLIATFRNMDANLVRDVLPEVYLVLAGALMRGGEMSQAHGTCDIAVEMAGRRVDAHKSRGRSGAAMHAVGIKNEAERVMVEIETVQGRKEGLSEEKRTAATYSPGVKVANPRDGSPAADKERSSLEFHISENVKKGIQKFGVVFDSSGKVELEGVKDDLTKDQCLYSKVKDAFEDALNRDDVEQASALLSDPRIRSTKFYFTSSKQTPLLISASRGASDMTKLLLQLGADPNEGNCSSITPLQIAAYHCSRTNTCDNLSVAELLIEHGADVKGACETSGDTPLHSAAAFGCSSFAKLLVDKGANANASNRMGNTPLHQAAEWRVKGIVEYLLEVGADVHSKNENGETPLDLCLKGTCGGKSNDVAEVLREWEGKSKKQGEE